MTCSGSDDSTIKIISNGIDNEIKPGHPPVGRVLQIARTYGHDHRIGPFIKRVLCAVQHATDLGRSALRFDGTLRQGSDWSST